MSPNLIHYFVEILAHPQRGMTWTQIVKFFRKKSIEYKVSIPYANTIFPSHLLNRRIGFIENLKAFSPEQQTTLLKELLDAHKKANYHSLKKDTVEAGYSQRV